MKKKAIEKIPYFGLKETSRKKAVKYIGVTAVKIVGHERHLFLEIYRNKKKLKDTPVVRIVTTKKDFGTYYPEKDTWTREKIEAERGWGMEDHGAADEAGTGQEEDDTDGEESGQADCEEPAERTDEQTGAQSQREEIAPAQKSTETLEKEEVEDDETGENESSDAENQTAESEPETAEREQTEETEVIEAVYGTRKEYMDRLSEQGMAEYMADEYKSHRLLVTDLENTWNLCKWLSEKVVRFGKPMEDAR